MNSPQCAAGLNINVLLCEFHDSLQRISEYDNKTSVGRKRVKSETRSSFFTAITQLNVDPLLWQPTKMKNECTRVTKYLNQFNLYLHLI